ncbi:hypothetical protein I588_04487 [Enterococcus pallens ATCC BAA-351]|uniref:Uncharacterized protein n=1 Tax=Enterococcus pallens ATCC BAA-351 TaxID=1158607 RepID=R2T3N3_9ENTE|nr:hypothetical protein UAU_01766 [Enterococcus pallens ATCC BAA-351]EOU14837.1 hypothetical protein I588_04487 [Enterococcus pallens ATCC BAA-351]OJG76214.1 hypothetical protein RV10_GL004121 [Enterococcus pallens]
MLKEIEGLKKIRSTIPAEWKEFPCAIYSTKAKAANQDLSMEETFTKWTVSIDVYDNRNPVTNLAEEVIKRMNKLGFKNEEAGDNNVTGLFRVQLKFTGTVNNKTLLVTH